MSIADLTLTLADSAGLRWAQDQVTEHHYLHHPVDVRNAATWAIGQALKRVGFEFLVHRPVVWMEEPYEIREILSYCNRTIHNGTLYRAANFQLKRHANRNGIETYTRPLRRLVAAEIARRSLADQRARRLRADRLVTQPTLL